MPHTFADDRDRHITALGNTCPWMPTDIHRQGYWQIQQFPDFLQQMVYPMKCVGVLFPVIFITFCNNGQEVFRFVYWIFVKNILHTFFPFDEQLLSRFTSAVGKDTVLQVFLPQISHIDEWHSPCIETEQEHIASVVKIGLQWQVKPFDTPDGIEW